MLLFCGIRMKHKNPIPKEKRDYIERIFAMEKVLIKKNILKKKEIDDEI